jgi:hypothetical protein
MLKTFLNFFPHSDIYFQHDLTSRPVKNVSSISVRDVLSTPDLRAPYIRNLQKENISPFYTINGFYQEPEKIKINKEKTGYPYVTSRFKDNLQYLQACFVDLDLRKEGQDIDIKEAQDKALGAINDLAMPPTILVTTKNGYQLLWCFPEPMENPTEHQISIYTQVENALIEWSKTIGGAGDAVKDVSRILRLPGWKHLKDPQNPFEVSYIITGDRYMLEDILDQFKEFLPQEEKKKSNTLTIYKPQKYENGLDFEELNHKITIRDAVESAFRALGVSFEEDKSGRWIIDGRLSGNFYNKMGSNVACTTSGQEPYSGPPTAVVFQIFKKHKGEEQGKKEAFEFLKNRYGFTQKPEVQSMKLPPVQQENLDRFQLNKEAFLTDIFSRRFGNYYSWGMEEVDKEGGLLTLGRIAIIGGGHGSGKSTYVTELAKVNSETKKTMLIPLEMGSEYTIMMLACNLFNREREDMEFLKYGEVEEGYLYLRPQRDQDFFKECIGNIYLQYPNLHVGVPIDLKFESLKTFITNQYEKEGICFFVIDHLHQLDTSSLESDNDVKFYSDVAKGLKELAEKLNIALLCIVQLTKFANSSDAIIDLSSFKGTSEFTSNAHRVVIIRKPVFKGTKTAIKKELSRKAGTRPPDDEVDAEQAAQEKIFNENVRHVRELYFLKTRGRDTCTFTIRMDRGHFEFAGHGDYNSNNNNS